MYYYRPQRKSTTTTRPRPSASRERFRQEHQGYQPVTQAPERDEPAGPAPATGAPEQQAQATPVLDTHTLLLVLILLERLAQAEAREQMPSPSIETEHLVVESIPPAAPVGEEEDGPYAPSHPSRTYRLPVVLLALCVLICLAVIAVSLVPLETA